MNRTTAGLLLTMAMLMPAVGAGCAQQAVIKSAQAGEPAKTVTIPKTSGFVTKVHDGRLWVWHAGDEQVMHEKHVTRIGAGPGGMTVRALDRETLDAYLQTLQ